MNALFLMILMVCLTTLSQYLIKSALNNRRMAGLITGALLMAGAPLLYIRAISLRGLAGIYGLNGLSYLMVFLVSVCFLKERAGRYQAAGIVMITAGVVLWNLA